MDTLPLFDHYPNTPGWKRTDTSVQAADAIAPTAENLRDMCYQRLRVQDLSADEIAELLEVDRLSIRPRLSELRVLGKVRDTGKRTRNRSGKSAIVWGVAA